MTEVTLREGTVTRVEGASGAEGSARVGCGNFWERTFLRAALGARALEDPRPSGPVTALSARVSVDGQVHELGEGSEVEIAGGRWVVVAIEKTPGERGRLRLRRLG